MPTIILFVILAVGLIIAVDNLQRARLNYPVDPQKPGQPSAAPKSSP